MRSDLTENIPAVKVVLLGESGVGKSSIALRFTKNEFSPYTNSTIGASFMSRRITLSMLSLRGCSETFDNVSSSNITTTGNNKHVEIKIWDTAGQEKYLSCSHLL